MRFVEQLVAEQSLLKFYEIGCGGESSAGWTPSYVPHVGVIPNFCLRLAVGRHLCITNRQVGSLLGRIVEAGVIHSGGLVDMFLNVAVVILAGNLFDNRAQHHVAGVTVLKLFSGRESQRGGCEQRQMSGDRNQLLALVLTL